MGSAPRGRHQRVAFLATWAVAAVYALFHLDVGWFPADAGAIGQAAERVLRGELPHRDFHDIYTGGLALLHAAAFKVLGVGVMTMRWVTYALYLAWIPAVWILAARLGGPVIAVLATLLAASWSLPVYPEAMPSWYNLFLATLGTLSLLRFADTRARRWLVLAGVAGGLSILVKVVGLYFLAAAGLYLLHDEAARARGTGVPARDGAYRATALAACTGVAAAVVWLVLRGMGPRHFFLYGVPPLAAIVPVAIAVSHGTGHSTRVRLSALGRAVGPLAVGAAAPILLFLVPYLASGAVGDLVGGVLVRPSARLDEVRMIGPAGQWWFGAPAVALILWHALARLGGRWTDRGGLALGSALWLLLLAGSSDDVVYLVTFRALLWMSPLIALVAAWRIAGRAEGQLAASLVLLAYGFASLVQVPFAAPAYFFYAAPLGVLAAVAAVEGVTFRARERLAVTLAGLLAFSVLRLNEGVVLDVGIRYRDDLLTERMTLPRAMGLRVTAEDKRDYETLFNIVSTMGGTALYAGPDAPEVYFLTGRVNPTPTLFDLLEDPYDREAQVLAATARADVPAVVIRPRPLFSAPLSQELIEELERRFPRGRQVGRFIVAWRGPP